jgi:hypothetical protein
MGGREAVEVKVGNATLTDGQAEFFYEVANGQDVYPVGANAEAAGFRPGVGVVIGASVDHWEGP